MTDEIRKTDEADEPAEPVLRFVQGQPTEDEVAAVTMVLLSRLGTDPSESADETTASGWAGYWRRTRRSLRPGPDAWRLSLRR